MAYCTKEHVADEFQGITFSATTSPTADTVDRWIAEADVLINSKVGLRYTTPITDATDLLLMRMICIMLVSARVRRRLKRQGPSADVESKDSGSGTDRTALSMLNDIVLGKTSLSENSALKSSEVGMTSWQIQDGDTCPHTFKKDCEQW